MNVYKDCNGLESIDFKDNYDNNCGMQVDLGLLILSVDNDVNITLNRRQVNDLIPHLIEFVISGKIGTGSLDDVKKTLQNELTKIPEFEKR